MRVPNELCTGPNDMKVLALCITVCMLYVPFTNQLLATAGNSHERKEVCMLFSVHSLSQTIDHNDTPTMYVLYMCLYV